jgi:hypothetical protein
MSKRYLLITFIAFVTAVVIIRWWVEPVTRSFDSSTWQAADGVADESRLEMADDLFGKAR